MSLYVLPYKIESESATLLARGMGVKRIRRENSKFKYKEGDVIINWGCTERPPHIPEDAIVINPFSNVAQATNKVIAFEKLDNTVRIPDYTDDPELVYEWLKNGRTVVGRKKVNGYGGEGIVLIEPEDVADIGDIPVCPLYTKYVPKKSEYRVHVVRGDVISVARKTLKKDHPNKGDINWKIRNLDGGFIFSYWNEKEEAEEGNCCHIDVLHQAVKAINTLGLDFGAVDVIFQERFRKAYVLEVNTAPGLGEEIAKLYASVFKENPPLVKKVGLEELGGLVWKKMEHNKMPEEWIDGPIKPLKLKNI